MVMGIIIILEASGDMKFDDFTKVICVLVVFIALSSFFYLSSIGIKMGYKLNGGKDAVEDFSENIDELLREYDEQVRTYELYKDSENSTAQKWAATAKEKANDIAFEYNKLVTDNFLKRIGE